MKIIKKEPAGFRQVYDIGVPKDHNFAIENGAFASNCFNKAHSLHYSYLSYACMWLKANYPAEFFCALMTVRSQSQPKKWASIAPQYLHEAKMLGVEVIGPQVNYSDYGFKIDNNIVYFGISAIRDLGKVAARNILKARGQTKFKDIFDFVGRVNRQKVNKKAFEALAKAGAFDRMGYIRSELTEKAEALYEWYASLEKATERKIEITQQQKEIAKIEKLIEERDALRTIKRKSEYKRNPGEPLNSVQEARLQELEDMKLRRLNPLKPIEPNEKPSFNRTKKVPLTLEDLLIQANYIGCFVGDHPAHKIFPNTQLITNCEKGDWIETAGMVNKVKKIKTRKGDDMAFLDIGDESGPAEVILFPSTYKKLAESGKLPEVNDIIKIQAKCENTEPIIKFICNSIELYKGNI